MKYYLNKYREVWSIGENIFSEKKKMVYTRLIY